MNDNDSVLWPHQLSGGHGGSEPPDDFSSFLNFSGDFPLDESAMDTDFSAPGNLDHTGTITAGGHEHHMGMEDEMLGIRFPDIQQHKPMQPHLLDPRPGMQSGGLVPPTPTSMELQGGIPHGAYATSMPMDPYYGPRDDQMLFTPLVSPAVTPLETAQHIPDFGMPFSPLTSPALEAQHRIHVYPDMRIPRQNYSTSPIDTTDSVPVQPRAQQGRRKSTTSRRPSRVVRDSPIMKPQQRRKQPPPLMPTPEMSAALAQQAISPALRTPGSSKRASFALPQPQVSNLLPGSSEGSSNESVSPEPLPEVLMAPPPPRKSPNEEQNGENANGTSFGGAPVTPASLMKLHNTNMPTDGVPPISMDTSEYLASEVIHDGTDGNIPAQKDTQTSDEQTTPTIRSSRTPSLNPSHAGSRQQSPHSAQKSSGNKKAESSKGPPPRKRGSVSSSPALQPKISPSIKPLLPQGMSPDASALLLVTKSNYQNIVEGNHSQLGLSYPADLSTNLTSKRTSHKIAEQGRRNRINNALAEIAALLPPSSGGSGSEGGGPAAVSAASPASAQSKASTVEMAIEYIKELRKELADTKGALAEAQQKLGEHGDQ